MSKMDGLRAMREARYEEAAARAATAKSPSEPVAPASAAPRATAMPKPTRSSVPDAAPAATVGEPEAALCGHRAISGRTCTRETGHAAKSHRYS